MKCVEQFPETASNQYLYHVHVASNFFWGSNYLFFRCTRKSYLIPRILYICIESINVPKLLLPYFQAQTVGLPVTVHSPNVRLMRSALLPPASNVEAFSFPASSCQAEAAFMEEECVDTPKVRTCLRDSELAVGPGLQFHPRVLYFGFGDLCHFLKSLRSVVFLQKWEKNI